MNSKIWLMLASVSTCYAADILMITMGGTKSHKIPFLELAKGLMPRCVLFDRLLCIFLLMYPDNFLAQKTNSCIVLCFAMTGATMWHSWADFQPITVIMVSWKWPRLAYPNIYRTTRIGIWLVSEWKENYRIAFGMSSVLHSRYEELGWMSVP